MDYLQEALKTPAKDTIIMTYSHEESKVIFREMEEQSGTFGLQCYGVTMRVHMPQGGMIRFIRIANYGDLMRSIGYRPHRVIQVGPDTPMTIDALNHMRPEVLIKDPVQTN